MSCDQRLGESRINPQFTRSSLKNPNEYIIAPEDAMQIDLYRDYLRPLALKTL